MSLTLLIVTLGFLVGCGLALIRHPIYGLMSYVGIFYLSPPMRWWGQPLLWMRWSFVAAGVTMIAIFIHRKKLLRDVPFRRHGAAIAYVLFAIWLAIQSFWALDPAAHQDLLSYYVKFIMVMFLIYRCVDSEKHLKLFLWTHVLGCFYFGWIAFTSYDGGRFEDFGGPGLSEANAGALTIVTGIFAASCLFLGGTIRQKVALVGIIPVIVNALVTTISRSGFLAAAIGGVIFNLFSPKQYRKTIRVLSILAIVMFGMLTGPTYWQRMQTIKALGEDVEGVDTGSGRLVIIAAQLQMFGKYPLGCGATCTAVLSKYYLDDKELTGEGENRARASHNTFFTMLVEHGVPGAIFYFVVLFWIFKNLRKLNDLLREQSGFMMLALPAVASMLIANCVSDMFATYAKFEIRIWFIATLMAMINIATAMRAAKVAAPELRPEITTSFRTPRPLPIGLKR